MDADGTGKRTGSDDLFQRAEQDMIGSACIRPSEPGMFTRVINKMSWDMRSCEEERQDVSCASRNQTYSTHDSCRVDCISHSAALSCVLFGFSAQISSGVFAQQKALACRTGTCAGWRVLCSKMADGVRPPAVWRIPGGICHGRVTRKRRKLQGSCCRPAHHRRESALLPAPEPFPHTGKDGGSARHPAQDVQPV